MSHHALTNRLLSRPLVYQGQSPLIRLPGEIRNRIYDYVLKSYDTGELAMLPVLINEPESPYSLHTRHYGEKSAQWYEVNQLRYVCRQLYFETRYIGLHGHPTFYFPVVKNAGPLTPHYPGPEALRFLKTLAPVFWSRLSWVEIDAHAMCVCPSPSACEWTQNEMQRIDNELDKMKVSPVTQDPIELCIWHSDARYW
jgi:hypothetical protein